MLIWSTKVWFPLVALCSLKISKFKICFNMHIWQPCSITIQVQTKTTTEIYGFRHCQYQTVNCFQTIDLILITIFLYIPNWIKMILPRGFCSFQFIQISLTPCLRLNMLSDLVKILSICIKRPGISNWNKEINSMQFTAFLP